MGTRLFLLALVFVTRLTSAGPVRDEDPSLGPCSTGQSIADVLKEFTGAAAAFVPAGEINKPLTDYDLASTLNYPKDGVEVVELSGAQLRAAFELSAMLYPEPNVGFLQVSGFEISFNKAGPPKARITSVTVNGAKLEDGHNYEVAMPTSLQRGQLGYANLWEKAKIVRTFDSASLGSVLHGKHPSQSSPRWLPQG